MKKIKVLNLYAGIGGNRKLWNDDEVEVTAVENVPEIAKIYQEFFPNDKVIIADAHQYLLEHFKEFDFIWSSPPCPTHSRMRALMVAQGSKVVYPNMDLYQEILLLQNWFKGKWVVENVKSYYPPLYPPKELDRHYFWTNFPIVPIKIKRDFNIANARANNKYESLTLGTLPFQEMKLLYRVILKNVGGTPTPARATDLNRVQTGITLPL